MFANGRLAIRLPALALAALLCSGCPEGITIDIPIARAIRVDVINATNFDVAPNIIYDRSTGFLARLFPSERLATGLLAPGETLSFTFDCDRLGVILSDEAEQLTFGTTFVAPATSPIERDREFGCRDTVEFLFIGDGIDFGVIVSVNGRIVTSS